MHVLAPEAWTQSALWLLCYILSSCESVYELVQTTPTLFTSCPAAGGKSGKGDNR